MSRDLDMNGSNLEQSGEVAERYRRKGLAGCFAGLLVSPALGLGVGLVADWQAGLATAVAAFFLLSAWSLIQFTRAGSDGQRPATWSFTPAGSGLIAMTDVLAMGGDVFGPGTYLLLSIPCALLGGAGIFLTEILESRRPIISVVKACVATLLIAIPAPVGGLVGAGASLGHRALRNKSSEG